MWGEPLFPRWHSLTFNCTRLDFADGASFHYQSAFWPHIDRSDAASPECEWCHILAQVSRYPAYSILADEANLT